MPHSSLSWPGFTANFPSTSGRMMRESATPGEQGDPLMPALLSGSDRIWPHLIWPTLFGCIWPNHIWPTLFGRIWPILFDRIWQDRIWPIFFVEWWGVRCAGVVGVLLGCCWSGGWVGWWVGRVLGGSGGGHGGL